MCPKRDESGKYCPLYGEVFDEEAFNYVINAVIISGY